MKNKNKFYSFMCYGLSVLFTFIVLFEARFFIFFLQALSYIPQENFTNKTLFLALLTAFLIIILIAATASFAFAFGRAGNKFNMEAKLF